MSTFGLLVCIGDGEHENKDFRGKMMNLEKVRYGSNAKKKRRKIHKYWSFEMG
jgi:hypothetical protein